MENNRFKSKNFKKWCKYILFGIVTFVMVPKYFQSHETYRFFFAVLSGVAFTIQTCLLFYGLLHKKPDTQRNIRQYLKFIAVIILNLAMAFQLYNWNELTQIFPQLLKISKSALLLIIGCPLLLSGLLAGIYLFMPHNPGQKKSSKTKTPHAQVNFSNAACTPNDEPATKNSDPGTPQGEYSHTSENSGITLPKIFGYIVVVLSICAGIFIVCYSLLYNNDIIQKLTAISIDNMFHIILWVFIAIAFVLTIVWVLILSAKQFVQIFCDTLSKNKKFDPTDNTFLMLASLLILIIVYTAMPDIDIDQFFGFMIEPREAAPIFKGLVMILGGLIFVRVIYRLLESFLKPNGAIKKHVSEIFDKLVDTVGESLKGIVGFTSIIPNFVESISSLFLNKDETETSPDSSLEKSDGTKKTHSSFWNFLNTCSLLLALISLFTTAEGINKFFFKGKGIYGYMASLAIQGFLMSLNLRLPKYISQKKATGKACIILLYGFTIFWSSAFSYIYVSNIIYAETAVRDQQMYLSSFYLLQKSSLEKQSKDALTTATAVVMDDIATFQNAANLSDTQITSVSTDVNLDFQVYKADFSSDAQMSMAIHVLENLTADHTSSDLTDTLNTLNAKKSEKQQILQTLDTKITTLEAEKQNKENERTNLITLRAQVPTNSAAHESYTTAITEAENTIAQKDADLSSLNTEHAFQQKCLNEIIEMISYTITFTNSLSMQTATTFSEIIEELGTPSSTMDNIDSKLNSIYSSITAYNTQQDASQSSKFFNDYIQLQSDLISLRNLRKVFTWATQEDYTILKTDNLIHGDSDDNVMEQWRSIWNNSLSSLKNSVMLMTDDAPNYDPLSKEKLTADINKRQRNYLGSLNEVEKAKLYLFSDYATLAWFSLIFAIYLDSAPMLLGIFKYYENDNQPQSKHKSQIAGTAFAVSSFVLFLCSTAILLFH